jgi:Na+/glutamate symporter
LARLYQARGVISYGALEFTWTAEKVYSTGNCVLVCIGHDSSIQTGHKVCQGSKKKSPQIPSFDFCFFIAVIDNIAKTTTYKTDELFLLIMLIDYTWLMIS